MGCLQVMGQQLGLAVGQEGSGRMITNQLLLSWYRRGLWLQLLPL